MINQPSPRSANRRLGFTLIELLVVISIIALLLAILLPALSQARRTALITVCGSNLRQIATGVTAYAVDEEGVYPNHWRKAPNGGSTDKYPYIFEDWGVSTGFVRNYMSTVKPDLFFCPASLKHLEGEEAADRRLRTLREWPSPAGLYAEITYAYYAGPSYNASTTGSMDPTNRRRGPQTMESAPVPSQSTIIADMAQMGNPINDPIQGTVWNHNSGDPRWARETGEPYLNIADNAGVQGAYVDGHVEMISGPDQFRKFANPVHTTAGPWFVHEQPRNH